MWRLLPQPDRLDRPARSARRVGSAKLGLPAVEDDDRRILAVLAYVLPSQA